ncbi:MAG: hypothetical protein V4708_14745 [Bacteroidota bacterium]
MTLNKRLSFRLKGLLPDPEGGRMFIVMGIPDKSTPKVVACV